MENKINCPKCQSEELYITTTTNKAIICRIIKTVCIGIAIIMFSAQIFQLLRKIAENNNEKTNQSALFFIVFTLLSIVLHCLQLFLERKSAIQCTCKKCKHTWIEE